MTGTLYGVWASGPNDVWVVGSGGTVLRSVNGGATWTRLTTSITTVLNAVWGSSAANIYFVGSSGLVWRTVDSTAITVVPSVSFSSFYGISGTDERAFTIVGSTSVLRKL